MKTYLTKNRFSTLGKLTKLFVILSLFIILSTTLIFTANLTSSLTMDKSSYDCTTDSMMMQFCHYPVSSSIFWTLLTVFVVGAPVLIAWLVLGVLIVGKYVFLRLKSSKYVH